MATRRRNIIKRGVIAAFLMGICFFVSASTADYSAWAHNETITIDASGITNNQVNFPLAVRLTTGNFPYDQADATALTDLRFSKSDGTALPYYIERYDANVLDSTMVWVLMDQVTAGTSNQIKMYWGNSGAVSESNSAAVFDSAKGFRLAMQFPAGGANAQFTDQSSYATVGHRNGTPPPTKRVGILGQCMYNGGDGQVFLGSAINPNPQFEPAGSFTLSAWVWQDSYRAGFPKILDYCDGAGWHNSYSLLSGDTNSGHDGTTVEFERGDVDPSIAATAGHCGSKTGALPLQTWTFIVGTFDATSGAMVLYINGTSAASITDAEPTFYPPAGPMGSGGGGTHNFNIGGFSQSCFKGCIDDVRLIGLGKDADWAMLSYLTQKADQTVVSIPAVGVVMKDRNNRLMSMQLKSTFRNGQLVINYQSGLTQQAAAVCRMYSMSGQKVLESRMAATNGMFTLNLAEKGVSPGAYILAVSGSDAKGKIIQTLKSKFTYMP
ncbi:MAG: DUF2341 domain-containing protein [Chitinivibrionales bacterium]|nr:DUF2341 domain-containing protein [Chitinivibrionales bacterium]